MQGFPARTLGEAWRLVRYFVGMNSTWTGGKINELKAFRDLGICPIGAIDETAWDVFRAAMRAKDGMGGLAYYPQRFAHHQVDEPLWYSQMLEEVWAEEGRLRAKEREEKPHGAEN